MALLTCVNVHTFRVLATTPTVRLLVMDRAMLARIHPACVEGTKGNAACVHVAASAALGYVGAPHCIPSVDELALCRSRQLPSISQDVELLVAIRFLHDNIAAARAPHNSFQIICSGEGDPLVDCIGFLADFEFLHRPCVLDFRS